LYAFGLQAWTYSLAKQSDTKFPALKFGIKDRSCVAKSLCARVPFAAALCGQELSSNVSADLVGAENRASYQTTIDPLGAAPASVNDVK